VTEKARQMAWRCGHLITVESTTARICNKYAHCPQPTASAATTTIGECLMRQWCFAKCDATNQISLTRTVERQLGQTLCFHGQLVYVCCAYCDSQRNALLELLMDGRIKRDADWIRARAISSHQRSSHMCCM
jgi:hypothetical protein